MKVIELLNKIANGEIDKNNEYQFSRDDYCTINDFFARYIVDEENLNLEILEEPKGIPEKLYHCCMETDNEETKFLIKNMNDLVDRYNEILDYLESKGE